MVSIITMGTELVSPIVALFLIIGKAGCHRVTKTSDPAFNTVFNLPETSGTARSEEQLKKYKDYLKKEYPEEYKQYFPEDRQAQEILSDEG